jgi:hypothetical protein
MKGLVAYVNKLLFFKLQYLFFQLLVQEAFFVYTFRQLWCLSMDIFRKICCVFSARNINKNIEL